MSFLLVIMALLLGAAGLLLAVKGVRAFGPAVRILARRTRPIARLEEGGVELAGRISSPTPLESLSGLRCVAVKTTVSGQSGDPKDEPTSRGSRSVVRTTPSILVDATSACRVDMDECELQGTRHVSPVLPVSTLAGIDWAMELVPEQSTHVTIEETVIVDGATVLLSGRASRDDAPAESYRDAEPGWVVHGVPEELLIVAEGREGWLLVRTIAIPTIVTLIGLGMTGMAASLAWVASL